MYWGVSGEQPLTNQLLKVIKHYANSSLKQIIYVLININVQICITLFVVSIVEDVSEVPLHGPEVLHIVAVVHGPQLPGAAQVAGKNVPAEQK